jgi:ribosome maturation factor RimP
MNEPFLNAESSTVATSWLASVERTVTGLGYELVDVERAARGLLRVTIDRVPGRQYPAGAAAASSDVVAAVDPDPGVAAEPAPGGAGDVGGAVTVVDCERVTRQLQYVLEVDGVDYERLEVSSPGLDRPLKRAADYERFAGHDISLALKLPLAGRKHFKGRLQRADAGWQLHLAADKPGEYTDRTLDFTLDDVREARLVPVIDFKGRSVSGKKLPRQTARQGVDGGH